MSESIQPTSPEQQTLTKEEAGQGCPTGNIDGEAVLTESVVPIKLHLDAQSPRPSRFSIQASVMSIVESLSKIRPSGSSEEMKTQKKRENVGKIALEGRLNSHVKGRKTRAIKKKNSQGKIIGEYANSVYTRQGRDLVENILPAMGITVEIEGRPFGPPED